MQYDYTRTDLYEGDPEHYHYSKIQNLEFLERYLLSRKISFKKLNFLNAQYSPKEVKYAPAKITTSDDGSYSIDTLKFLEKNCIEHLNTKIISPQTQKKLQILQKKFEVSKRLRTSYGKQWQLLHRDNAKIEAYAYFSYLLSAMTSGPRYLKELNTVIKLNDLIVSTTYLEMKPLARHCLAKSIETEIRLVEELSRSKGLQLEHDENS